MRQYQSVAVIKLKHLGDVLTTTPLIGAIKKFWPEARITYVVNPGAEDLVRFHPDVDEVLTVPRQAGLLSQSGFVRQLRLCGFDLVLELSEGDRGAFLARMSGARTRVGYRPRRRRRFDRRMAFTHLVKTRSVAKHTVEYHLDSLRILGLEPGPQLMALHWPPEAEATVAGLLNQYGLEPGKYAVVHPTSRWMFKAWRVEANAAVIDWLSDTADLPVVMTSAPDPGELDYCRRVLELVNTPVLDLTGSLRLPELAALLAGARVFFGVDSLPMHMAAAVGTNAVALFGPSGEHMWGPWGHGHRVVAQDWDCRPCGKAGCDNSGVSRCLEETKVEEAVAALADVLELRS